MNNRFSFGIRSREQINTLDFRLITLLHLVLYKSKIDFSVLEGYRDEYRQNKLHKEGSSKLKFPSSKHNCYPSKAVDIAPYPLDWNDIESFKALSITMKQMAKFLGIKLIWGGDWKNFKDYGHYEIEGD